LEPRRRGTAGTPAPQDYGLAPKILVFAVMETRNKSGW